MSLTTTQQSLLPKKLYQIVNSYIVEAELNNKLLSLSETLPIFLEVLDQVSRSLNTERVGYVSVVISGEGDQRETPNQTAPLPGGY